MNKNAVSYYKCDWKKRKYNHGETTWLLYWENAEISAIFFAIFAIFLDLGSDFDRVRTCFGEGIMPKSVHLCQWRSHCRLFEERLDKNSVKSTQKHHHFVRIFYLPNIINSRYLDLRFTFGPCNTLFWDRYFIYLFEERLDKKHNHFVRIIFSLSDYIFTWHFLEP